MWSWEATTFPSTLRPPSSTAAAVSSQDVSIPSTIIAQPSRSGSTLLSSRLADLVACGSSAASQLENHLLSPRLADLVACGSSAAFRLELLGQLRDGHEADASRLPARDILAQETRGERMPMRDHDDLAAALRPPGHLVPAHPVTDLSRRVVDHDLSPPRAYATGLGLVVGDGQVARQPV